MLSAVVITERGGETEWADLRAAYDALPASTKTHISTLSAEHFAFHSRVLLGDDRYDEKQLTVMPPVSWPLVRTHPGSGRKLLFVGVHCRAIAGMHPAEARLLIAELLEHATQRRFIYRHHWRVGDFVIWDNRSTLHRGLRYDLSERRELRRTTTVQNPAENF